MWTKKELVFNVNNYKSESIQSHAGLPFAIHIKDNLHRIYFSPRNKAGRAMPYYVDSEVSNGVINIIGKPVGPLLEAGELGTFDDSGIMPSCVLKHNQQVYMYYVGWNPQVAVSYRHSIGVAISDDEGKTFKRYSKGPVFDRGLDEPFFVTAPFVMIENGKWRMWYISCTHWQVIDNHPEPSYLVKYTESDDGIHWNKAGVVCVDYDERTKAIGRPCIIKVNGKYEMYFSYRNVADYRKSANNGYKIGLAVSDDGIKWQKKYDETGITLSESGWDNLMMAYCHVFEHQGIFYMIYNGNEFGKDGFGYAISNKK